MKKLLCHTTLLLAFVMTFFQGFSQTSSIDSLNSLLRNAKHDTTFIQLYIKIGFAFEEISSDSALNYYTKALTLAQHEAPDNQIENTRAVKAMEQTFRLKSLALHRLGELYTDEENYELAIENYTKSLRIKEQLDDKVGCVKTLSQMGIAHYYLGNLDQAIECFQKMLGINQELDDMQGIAQSHNNIGIIYRNQGFYDKALENYMSSLKIYEELNQSDGKSKCYNNIGIIHWSQQNFDKAIEYYLKALELFKKAGDKQGIAQCYNNIGIIYDDQGITEKAIDYYQKALKIHIELADKQGILACYNNMGVIFKTQAELASTLRDKEVKCDVAIENYRKSLKIALELGDKSGLAMVYGNLSAIHLVLGEALNDENHIEKVLDYAHRSYNFAVEIGSIPYQNDAASHLMNAYKTIGNAKEAFKYAQIYISTRQELFNSEKSKVLADAEAQFQTKNKQQEIDKQKILLDNQMLEASKQRTFRNAVIVALALSLLLAGMLYKGYEEKQLKNVIIQEKNAVLEQANSEILAQRDELEAQRDMVMSQNQKLEEAHTHITDSLHYAQSIQAAILPSEKILESISPDYFVFTKPLQVVSGDFFWAVNFENYKIFGIADCTGHGVPGAFMSILGLNALNDIVIRHRVVQPNQILGYLRDSVITDLGQNDPDQMHKDGMDMALCTFNTKTRELQYSGARLPLWIVVEDKLDHLEFSGKFSKSAINHNNHNLFEVKADMMPVGNSPRMKPFTLNTFPLKGYSAKLYLATDGFADQFGGNEATKYGAIQLKKLILHNTNKPFPQQKRAIEDEFNSWIGNGNQVDDLTILGIRL